jgi:hypothetical protein
MKLGLGIKARIYGGFGVLVSFGLALALFAAWQLTAVKGAVEKMSALSDNNTRALEIGREFEIMRRGSLRYKFDGEESALKQGTEAAAKATELLQAAAKATLSEERRKTYNGLEAGIQSFQKKRDSLIEITKKLLADKDTLFKVGDDVSATTDKLVTAARASTDAAVAKLASTVEADVLLVRSRCMTASAPPRRRSRRTSATQKHPPTRPLPAPSRCRSSSPDWRFCSVPASPTLLAAASFAPSSA